MFLWPGLVPQPAGVIVVSTSLLTYWMQPKIVEWEESYLLGRSGRVNCYWPSTAQPFLVPSPTEYLFWDMSLYIHRPENIPLYKHRCENLKIEITLPELPDVIVIEWFLFVIIRYSNVWESGCAHALRTVVSGRKN
jgi:hypothetical protein